MIAAVAYRKHAVKAHTCNNQHPFHRCEHRTTRALYSFRRSATANDWQQDINRPCNPNLALGGKNGWDILSDDELIKRWDGLQPKSPWDLYLRDSMQAGELYAYIHARLGLDKAQEMFDR